MSFQQIVLSLLVLLGTMFFFQISPRFDRADMRGKRVLVTGASQGIGENLAYELGKMGSHLVLVARSRDKLERISKACLELGAPSVHVISVDLSAREESLHESVIAEAVQFLGGGLDMVILNHVSTTGLLVDGWQEKFKLDVLVDQYYLNVFSYYALAHYAMPALQASRGKLVVVSSGTGILALPRVVGYSSQKHALHGYFNSLRSDLELQGKNNVTITLAVLGAIDTESFQVNTDSSVKVAAESPQETALAIIASGYGGWRTLYFPYSKLRPAHILSVLFPEFMDWVGRLAV